jgi:putative ABC transport system ATP-binding protein
LRDEAASVEAASVEAASVEAASDEAASDEADSDSPARRGEPIVRVSRLRHSFGEGDSRLPVLHDVDLAVYGGQIVILTGPSGSGKTTLLTLIGGLRSVEEGSVRVAGQELRGLSRPELVQVRRGIGFIFQAHNLFDSLTAYRNVRMALELRTADRDAIHRHAVAILTDLGLAHRMHHKPAHLSGGQKQRVAIARALVNRPRLILADEPTAALDKDSGQEVIRLLKKLAAEDGSAVLLVTHDNRILDAADRIVNMVDGRLESDVAVHRAVAICEFLKKCPPFATLIPATLADIADRMDRETYPAGAEIIRQGESGDTFYVIRHGAVDVLVEEAGSRRRVATLGESDFFGEGALLTGTPRNATVVARDETTLYALDQPHFQAALDGSLSLKDELLRVFAQRYRG